MPRGFVRAIVDRVIPSIVTRPDERQDGDVHIAEKAVLLREHVRSTVQMIRGYSVTLATAVDEGRCAIVGLEYALADGRVEVVETVGAV
jgi:carbonic anhydrase